MWEPWLLFPQVGKGLSVHLLHPCPRPAPWCSTHSLPLSLEEAPPHPSRNTSPPRLGWSPPHQCTAPTVTRAWSIPPSRINLLFLHPWLPPSSSTPQFGAYTPQKPPENACVSGRVVFLVGLGIEFWVRNHLFIGF